jgi:hypothetical protein
MPGWQLGHGRLEFLACTILPDYDIKLRFHRDMNFTMIRNWVGMTNHPAFYEACDRYGILVWDDF